MTRDERPFGERASGLDTTLRVGRTGIKSVADELASHLRDRELLKATLLCAARADTSTDELAKSLTKRAGTTLLAMQGNRATSH
jgi:RNA-binding protein